jgi:hypothetical protein
LRTARKPRNLAGAMRDAEKTQVHSRESTATRCPMCGGTGSITPAPAREGYYFRARAWVAASPRVRVAISPNRARDFRRIAALNDAWGLRLDELRASYRMVRWAGAPRYVAEREARYRALVKLLEEHGAERDVGKRFAALVERMPVVGRWAARGAKS